MARNGVPKQAPTLCFQAFLVNKQTNVNNFSTLAVLIRVENLCCRRGDLDTFSDDFDCLTAESKIFLL